MSKKRFKDENIILEFDNVIIKKPRKRDDFVPIGCPVCGFLMKDDTDVAAYTKYKCCNYCEMKWAQSRSDKWREGWRPNKDEIKKEIMLRKKIPPAFDF
mgnify:FL=1